MPQDMEALVFSYMYDLQDFSWSLPDDFMSFSHFVRVVRELDFSSTPGYPYNEHCNDNRTFLGAVNGYPTRERMLFVWSLVQQHIRERVSDPIYLFIKQEPHKESKKGRERLISAVSIIDQIVDHMLFDGFNEKVIEQAPLGSVKVGWSPMMGGWKVVPQHGVAIDKKGWDWTMQPWLFDAILKFKFELLRGDESQKAKWLDLASWRYRSLFFEAEFYVPSGHVLKQTQPGVMKSGSVVTIVDNSLAQVILHFRALVELGWKPREEDYFWALGDDTKQSKPRDLEAYLSKLSQFCVIKDYTELNEFSGCRFYNGGRIEPLYKGKHAYNLLHADPSIESDLAFSYALLYQRSIDKDNIRRILYPFGSLMPESYALAVWDGERD